MRIMVYAFIGLMLMACVTTTSSPIPKASSGKALSVESIYKDRAFKSASVPQLRWLKRQAAYTVLEAPTTVASTANSSTTKSPDKSAGKDIVKYTADSAERSVMVPASALIPQGSTEPITIDDYHWSDDETKLLLFTNSQKVWRNNTRGDYWLFDLTSKKLKKIGSDKMEPKQLMFAKLSPDASAVAFVYRHNIYVQFVDSHRIKQLTFDGSATIVNGATDWVYEEEFFLADGFRWSPDSKQIAYWQFDTSNAKNFTLINNTDALYPTTQSFPYPKVGEANAWVNIAVVDVANAKSRWIDLGPKHRDDYVPRLSWTPKGDELLIQQLDRAQQHNRVIAANVRNGKTRLLFTERDPAFIEQVYDVEWLNNDDDFLWISERDGWRHIYRASLRSSALVDLTPGEFDIIELAHVDTEKSLLYFTSARVDQGQAELYSVPLKPEITTDQDKLTNPIARITPQVFAGTNDYRISSDGQWAIHRYSTIKTPTQTSLISLPDHRTQRALELNDSLQNKLAELASNDVEFFQVNASDNTVLDGWLIRPSHFDARKKYPIIFYVYGEAWGQTVKDAWGGDGALWHQLLAQQGFVVASIDNRGTKAPKGRAWRKSIYKRAGVASSQDQAEALAAMLVRYPFIDSKRVGIWGHSGGGSSTLNMLFRYPEQYHVGIASAPVADIRLYDTIYQERYSGLLPESGEAYADSSPVTHAKNLQGHLLLIHGTGDDNVHYQGTERLINELVKHNKPFELMAYPNRSHSISEGEGTSVHMRNMMLRYFIEHLQPEIKVK